jgi:hypothetical protein
MDANAQSTLETLRLAIHGVTAPFSCGGSYVPDQPVVLVFRDKTRFEVVRAKDSFEQTTALKPLLAHCKPAGFGDGKKTRYDRSVRDALQLNADAGAFTVEGFDPESAGILAAIQRELVPHDPSPIAAELYSVNVYSGGGHFAPHKDTPRGQGMFGTLVVCLPSRFWRGDLILSHRGVVQKFDWGERIEKQTPANKLHWAAFFGDVDHQIDRVGDTEMRPRHSQSKQAAESRGAKTRPSRPQEREAKEELSISAASALRGRPRASARFARAKPRETGLRGGDS